MKLRHLITVLGGAVALAAGCAFMDLVWSNVISREDLERSNNISGVETCREMSHLTFQTWLIFNPEGLETFYLRSDCFMKVAVRDRDEDLCREVRERWSLYFDGSGVSEQACRAAVRQRKEADAKDAVTGEAHHIAGLSVQRIPGGDQAEVHVITKGSLPGIYSLTYALLDENGAEAGILEKVETPLGSEGVDRLGTMIYRRDVQRLLGSRYLPGNSYMLEVRLERVRDAGPTVPGRSFTPTGTSIARKRVAFD